MKLSKIEVLKRMENIGEIYKDKYIDTAYLFVYKTGCGTNATTIEVKFKDEHFLHLTGVISKLKAVDFYNNLLLNKLSVDSFDVTVYTEMKLRALNIMLGMDRLSCQIGGYKGNRPYLKADMIIGKKIAILGLVKVSKTFYVPRTVLEEQTGSIIQNPSPLIATFKKALGSGEKYKETYRNPKYEFGDFIKTLDDSVLGKIELEEG